jgi:hypothetical protein
VRGGSPTTKLEGAPSRSGAAWPIVDGVTIDQLVPGFRPETERERALSADPSLLEGLAWGRPRPGHPEGRVGRHVADILARVTERGKRREDLRFLALVHDAFKHRTRPEAGYSRENDHAVLARRFAEGYTGDERLLAAVELHDEPYWIWRTREGDGRAALAAVLARLPDVELFLRFVALDASTDGKDPGLIRWLKDATAIETPTPRSSRARGFFGRRSPRVAAAS